jgi:hypothetical protein
MLLEKKEAFFWEKMCLTSSALLVFLILANFCQNFVDGTTTTVAPIRTTTPSMRIFPQCGGCYPLRSGIPDSTFSTSFVSNKTDGCTQILTCNATGLGSSAGFIRLTLPRAHTHYQIILEDMRSIKVDVTCKNGNWYIANNTGSLTLYQNQEILTYYYCSYISPTTPMQMFTRTTKTSVPYTTTTTPRTTTTTLPETTSKPTVSTTCNPKGSLFQRCTATASISSKTCGNFAGYFQSRIGCQRLCNQNYKEKCYGYMYEPQNRGTCTIFQKGFSGKISENLNSKASVYRKCVKMPPAISEKCCGQLVQTPTFSDLLDDGDMTFTYNNNTCRSTAIVSCSDPKGKNNTMLVVNGNIVEYRINNIKFPATYLNGIWQMANPPLNVTSLECMI